MGVTHKELIRLFITLCHFKAYLVCWEQINVDGDGELSLCLNTEGTSERLMFLISDRPSLKKAAHWRSYTFLPYTRPAPWAYTYWLLPRRWCARRRLLYSASDIKSGSFIVHGSVRLWDRIVNGISEASNTCNRARRRLSGLVAVGVTFPQNLGYYFRQETAKIIPKLFLASELSICNFCIVLAHIRQW